MTRTRNKTRATTPPNAPPPHLKPHPTPILVSPLSTTSPDKGPTLRHPASPGSPSTHQTDRPNKKSTGKQNHPGCGTQYPHPGWHIFAPSHNLSDPHLHTHHLRPTRNNPPPPQGDAPQGDLQPGRQSQTANAIGNHPTTQTRNSTSPTNRHQTQPATSPRKTTHTQRPHPNKTQRTGGTHSKQQGTQTPRPHTSMKPPHHMASLPSTPTNRQARGSPATTRDHPLAGHTQPASRHSSQSKSKGDDK